MKKILMLTISSLFLVACGGSGGSGGSDTSSGNGSSDVSVTGNIAEPSLSEISGVWNDSIQEEGEELDVIYIVINDYGDFIFYDYFGDSYDKGPNCYVKENNTITDLGNGVFEIYFQDEDGVEILRTNASLYEESLILKFPDKSYAVLPKSTLQESDFSPLCVMNTRSSTSDGSAPEKKKKFFRISNNKNPK